MRISELSRASGVSVATIKYYLREGLLPAGVPLSSTQAEYDTSHVQRLRLVRALVEVAGLSLSSVRELLAVLDAPADPDPAGRVARAVATVHGALSSGAPDDAQPPERALAAMSALGWQVDPGTPALRQLESALAGLEAVNLVPGEATLRTYGEAALSVAEIDVTGVPTASAASTAEIVRYVVLGTVMYEPVLLALRRLAQQHVFRELSSRPRR
jgi:DNA-binding transcriptional MerR regulator